MASGVDPRRRALRAARLRRLVLLLVIALVAGLAVGLSQKHWRQSPTVATGAATKPLPAPPPKEITLAAVGDVMLDRGVWRRIRENGVHQVMAAVRPRLRAADLTFANLECPLSTVEGHAQPGGDLSFCADPGTVQALLDAGIDAVSVANNHSLDAGRQGLEDTLRTLEDHGIAYAGARPQGTPPDEVTYLSVGEVTVAFLAYTDLSFDHGSLCKVAPDMQNVLARVREARNKADVVVVSYHWGEEYEATPTERQRTLGHATIDAGADLILGSHPHVMSGAEFYHRGLILYSMGNFVFDQRDASDGRMTSAIFNVRVSVGRRLQLTIIPVRIPSPEYAPRVATDDLGGTILARLAGMSKDLGTPLQVDSRKAGATLDLGAAAGAARQPRTG